MCQQKKDSGIVYQQHHHHLINKLNDDSCPHVRFREDLLCQMKQWWKDGEQLILCLDANENIYHGKLGRHLTELDGLGMKEVVEEFTMQKLGATHFRGSEPIDGVWATGDITVINACMMPVGFGVGNHRLFVVDFAMTTLVGSGLTTGVCPALHSLNTKMAGCTAQYNKSLCRNILFHRLLERMVEAASLDKSTAEIVTTLNKLDQEDEGTQSTLKRNVGSFSQAIYLSLQRHHCGFTSVRFTGLSYPGMMESSGITATSATLPGGVRLTTHSYSLLRILKCT